MIGLDTNVLVRYFAQDDPVQSKRATELIESRLSEDEPGFVSVVAMVGMVWVLRRSYRQPDRRIAAVIERMLQSDALIVENEQDVFTAMVALKEGSGSFADALIAAVGMSAGCSHTVTFDRAALRLPGFSSI